MTTPSSINAQHKTELLGSVLQTDPKLSLLDALCKLGEFDRPWWYRTWRITAPSAFEYDKSEVLSVQYRNSRTIIATPIYSLFGRSGYLPHFISERYMHNQKIRAFVDIFHNWIIDHWVKMHTLQPPSVRRKSYTCYGLIRHLREWYCANHGKTIRIEIKQWQPTRRVFDGFRCNETKLGREIGNHHSMLNGVHIIVSAQDAVLPIQQEASNYCETWTEVQVSASGAESLGRGVLEGIALKN
jgi:hypothetical protein